jgi:hypothetical protein
MVLTGFVIVPWAAHEDGISISGIGDYENDAKNWW